MALYGLQQVPANIDPSPSANPTLTSVSVGITSGSVLAANPNRKGFTLANNSNRTIYVGTSNSVSTTSNFFAEIPPRSLYEWSLHTIYTGAIFAIASGAGASLQAFELLP